jgi:hypothetical protein
MVDSAVQSPYGLGQFRELMFNFIDVFIMKQAIQSDITIAILNILNNLNASQWNQVFPPEFTLNQILNGFIYQASK